MTTPSARIVCMVPSWTEMLVSAGVNVVGRTRFCVEPHDFVKDIPAVGGTKDWDFLLVESLQPTLLILDKEENPEFMSEDHDIPFVATHVSDLESCAFGIAQIKEALGGQVSLDVANKLEDYADRWRNIAQSPPHPPCQFHESIPGLIEWVRPPIAPIISIYYVIWKSPWMVASRSTFIGAVCAHLGIEILPETASHENKYPEVILERFDPETTLLLFSSEPFPFHKKKLDLLALPYPCAIVDGQSFSWFGIRSLIFMENQRR